MQNVRIEGVLWRYENQLPDWVIEYQAAKLAESKKKLNRIIHLYEVLRGEVS